MDSTRGSTSTEIFSKVWCLVLWYITVWTDDQRQDSLSRFGFSHTICLLKVELLKDVRIFYRILLSDISRFTLRQGHTWHTWEWLWFGATWLQSKSWRGVNLCCGGRGWSFKKKKDLGGARGTGISREQYWGIWQSTHWYAPDARRPAAEQCPFQVQILLHCLIYYIVFYCLICYIVFHCLMCHMLLHCLNSYIIYVSHFSCIIYTCHCS